MLRLRSAGRVIIGLGISFGIVLGLMSPTASATTQVARSTPIHFQAVVETAATLNPATAVGSIAPWSQGTGAVSGLKSIVGPTSTDWWVSNGVGGYSLYWKYTSKNLNPAYFRYHKHYVDYTYIKHSGPGPRAPKPPAYYFLDR